MTWFNANLSNSGGGGGGSMYSCTCLWDYVNNNSGTIPFGTYNFTLSRSIDFFDDILIVLKSYSSDSGDWNSTTQHYVNVIALNNNPMHANYVSITSFGQRASAFNIVGTTLNKYIDSESNINGLVAVYGIKY